MVGWKGEASERAQKVKGEAEKMKGGLSPLPLQIPWNFEKCIAHKMHVRTIGNLAFYGYSSSSLTVSRNIAKTVNKALKLPKRQKIATTYPAI